jgi:hypothetical protein
MGDKRQNLNIVLPSTRSLCFLYLGNKLDAYWNHLGKLRITESISRNSNLIGIVSWALELKKISLGGNVANIETHCCRPAVLKVWFPNQHHQQYLMNWL